MLGILLNGTKIMLLIEIFFICFFQIIFFLIFKKKIFSSKLFEKLIDKPGKDKIHSIQIPLVGGIFILFSIFTYLFSSLIFNNLINEIIIIFIIGTVFAFLVGFVDDLLHIKAEKKIIAITLFNIIFFQKLEFFQTKTLLFYSNFFSIEFSVISLSLIISILTFLVCHYALVIIDGINGIFGSYTIGFFLVLLLFFEISLPLKNLIVYFIIVLTFITFLNFRNILFFGNSGSLMISAMIPYILLEIYNERSNQIFIFSFLSLVIIPVLDMVRLFFLRILDKKSPFEKDLNHFHHKLLKKYKLTWTLVIYLSLCFLPFITAHTFELDPFALLIIQVILFFTLNYRLKLQN